MHFLGGEIPKIITKAQQNQDNNCFPTTTANDQWSKLLLQSSCDMNLNNWSSLGPEPPFRYNFDDTEGENFSTTKSIWPIWARPIIDNAKELFIPPGFENQLSGFGLKNEGKFFYFI